MKKIVFILLVFCACQKEVSREEICGIVVAKNAGINNFTVDVDYEGTIVTENAGGLTFFNINIGDRYCK